MDNLVTHLSWRKSFSFPVPQMQESNLRISVTSPPIPSQTLLIIKSAEIQRELNQSLCRLILGNFMQTFINKAPSAGELSATHLRNRQKWKSPQALTCH